MFSALTGKTILVTGGRGFIGQHLIERLQKIAGVNIIACTRSDVPVSSGPVRWLCTGLQELNAAFWKKHNIQHIHYVFHLGAYTPKGGVDANNIEAIFRDNLSGTHNLLNSLPGIPERIVFASTLDVYALSTDEAEVINESSRVEPASLYGSSKLFGEQLVKHYATQNRCAYSILRYGHIYGPGEMAYRKFIPETIRKFLAKQSPVIFGDGSTRRDFLYVDDAVEATLRAAVHSSAHLEPVNIVSGQSITLREIAECLARYSDSDIEPQYFSDKPNGSSLRFDNQLMKHYFGVWELMPLTEGLRQEYAYFKQQSV